MVFSLLIDLGNLVVTSVGSTLLWSATILVAILFGEEAGPRVSEVLESCWRVMGVVGLGDSFVDERLYN